MNNKNNTPIEVIEYLCDYHEQFGALPTPYVTCNVSGTSYTMFGSNLANRILRAGGIKELLTTFTGRGQVKKEKKAEVKAEGTEQVRTTITKRVRPSRSKAAIAAAQAEKIASETAEEVTA
jgi:hypothetical protein